MESRFCVRIAADFRLANNVLRAWHKISFYLRGDLVEKISKKPDLVFSWYSGNCYLPVCGASLGRNQSKC